MEVRRADPDELAARPSNAEKEAVNEFNRTKGPVYGDWLISDEHADALGAPTVEDPDFQPLDDTTGQWEVPTHLPEDKDPQAVVGRVVGSITQTLVNNPEMLQSLVKAWQDQMPAANIAEHEYREMALLFETAMQGDWYAIQRIAEIRAKAMTQTVRNRKGHDKGLVSLGDAG